MPLVIPSSASTRLPHALRDPLLAQWLASAVRAGNVSVLSAADEKRSAASLSGTDAQAPTAMDTQPSQARVVLLLDYDGTLAPIVNDPAAAAPVAGLIPVLRAAGSPEALHAGLRVVILSGRSVAKVRNFLAPVGSRSLANVIIAGSHGYDVQWASPAAHATGPGAEAGAVGADVGVAGPAPWQHQPSLVQGPLPDVHLSADGFQPFSHMLPLLGRARDTLVTRLQQTPITGATVEDNGYSVSLHYRNTPQELQGQAEALARAVCAEMNGQAKPTGQEVTPGMAVQPAQGMGQGMATAPGLLEVRPGKMVWELRPDVKWGKGHAAILVLSQVLGVVLHEVAMAIMPELPMSRTAPASMATTSPQPPTSHIPPFIIAMGDDYTDEDMFRALNQVGRAMANHKGQVGMAQPMGMQPMGTSMGQGLGQPVQVAAVPAMALSAGQALPPALGMAQPSPMPIHSPAQGHAHPHVASILVATPLQEEGNNVSSTGAAGGVSARPGVPLSGVTSTHATAHADMRPHTALMPRPTAAGWYLRDPAETRDMLAWVVATLAEREAERVTQMNAADVHPMPQEPGNAVMQAMGAGLTEERNGGSATSPFPRF